MNGRPSFRLRPAPSRCRSARPSAGRARVRGRAAQVVADKHHYGPDGRTEYGHTPLSIREKILWKCRRFVIGTDAHGAMMIMPNVRREAAGRDLQLITLPTRRAIKVFEKSRRNVNAVVHVTC